MQAAKVAEAEQSALLEAAKKYASGEYSSDEYEQEQLRIKKDYALQRFDLEMNILNDIVAQSGLSEEAITQFKEAQLKKRLEYAQYINKLDLKDFEDKAKERERKEEEEKRKKEEIDKEIVRKRKELISELFNFAGAMIDASTERQLQALEKELKAISKYADERRDKIDRLEESGALAKEDADKRKAAIDFEEQARQEEIERKKAELQRKQAIYNKANSAMQAIVNTALAITSVAPVAPLMAMVAAIGAIQLATILAQPIPEYALGTEDHKGGYAVVGDGDRPELAILPSGAMYKTPAIPTLVDMPKGTVVKPDYRQAIEEMTAVLMFNPPPAEDAPPISVSVSTKRLEHLKSSTNQMMTDNNLMAKKSLAISRRLARNTRPRRNLN